MGTDSMRIGERAAVMVMGAASGPQSDPETRLQVRVTRRGYQVACLHDDGIEQVIAVAADDAAAEVVVAKVLEEAEDQKGEVVRLVSEGEVPPDVRSFTDLQSHMDANMLGRGGDGIEAVAAYGVGVGAPDADEAWCGFLNCAHNAVDHMIRSGALSAVPSMAPGRR